MSASGDKYLPLAVLIPQSGLPAGVEDNGDSVGAFTSQINSLKSAGATSIIFLRGESGGEIPRPAPRSPR